MKSLLKKISIISILMIMGSICFAQSGIYEVVNPSTFLNEKIEKYVCDNIVEGVTAYDFKYIDGMPIIKPKYEDTLDKGERFSQESVSQLRDLMARYVRMFIPETWRDEVPKSIIISDTDIVIVNRHQDVIGHYTVISVRERGSGGYKYKCKEAKKVVMERYTDRIWLFKIDDTVYQVVLVCVGYRR